MYDRKKQWKAWLYLLPMLILLAVFTVWPIFNTLRLAFLEGYNATEAIGGTAYKVGFGNFKSILEAKGEDVIVDNVVYSAKYYPMLRALGNTAFLCLLTVPLSTILALLIAVGLNSIRPLKRFLQTIFFLPYVTNSIAIGMVFAAMFNIVGLGTADESIGIINSIIEFFGGTKINWMNSNSSWGANMAVMTVYIIWNALPFKILVLLGGLQGINKQYYDAAKVDGTSRSRILTRITVPLLSPMIAYVVITGFIGAFKEYSSVVGIFGEDMGPTGDAGKLQTMVGLIQDSIKGNTGEASAAALILFVIILIITLINLRVSKKRVHY